MFFIFSYMQKQLINKIVFPQKVWVFWMFVCSLLTNKTYLITSCCRICAIKHMFFFNISYISNDTVLRASINFNGLKINVQKFGTQINVLRCGVIFRKIWRHFMRKFCSVMNQQRFTLFLYLFFCLNISDFLLKAVQHFDHHKLNF